MEKFSTFETKRILRIKQSRLFHWMRGGFIPEGELVEWGRGYKTVFSLYDLYSIAFFTECVDYGLSRKVAKEYMEYVDWYVIIKQKKRFLVVQYYKDFQRDKYGRQKIRIRRGPWFVKDLKEIIGTEVEKIGFYVDLNSIMESVNNRI